MGSGEWRVSRHERCDNISDGPDPEPEAQADHSPSPLWQVATYNVCFDEQHQRERFKALCCLLCDEVLRFSYYFFHHKGILPRHMNLHRGGLGLGRRNNPACVGL